MAPIDSIRRKARRAYELGRLKVALRVMLAVVPMVAFSLAICARPMWTIAMGSVLAVSTVAFRWRGGAYGRAVIPGLVAGSVPLLLPAVMRSFDTCVGGMCCTGCMVGCVAGGLLAGANLGLDAATTPNGRAPFLLAATVVAASAGALGCAIVGAAGVAGMAVAVVASSLPVAIMARARAA